MSIPRAVRSVGFWSAVIATVCGVAYDIAQMAEWLGWLGSRGGPESGSTPLGIAVLLTPSLLLGPAFVTLMVSVHQLAVRARRVYSHAAVAFATAYAVLTGVVYFVQLTLIAPRMARGTVGALAPFVFVPFESFLYPVDLLGYSFMSIATLFAAQALGSSPLERRARWFLTGNGLLLPFIALQMYWHPLIWIAALWAVTFPASTWTLALVFRRAGDSAGDPIPG